MMMFDVLNLETFHLFLELLSCCWDDGHKFSETGRQTYFILSSTFKCENHQHSFISNIFRCWSFHMWASYTQHSTVRELLYCLKGRNFCVEKNVVKSDVVWVNEMMMTWVFVTFICSSHVMTVCCVIVEVWYGDVFDNISDVSAHDCW